MHTCHRGWDPRQRLDTVSNPKVPWLYDSAGTSRLDCCANHDQQQIFMSDDLHQMFLHRRKLKAIPTFKKQSVIVSNWTQFYIIMLRENSRPLARSRAVSVLRILWRNKTLSICHRLDSSSLWPVCHCKCQCTYRASLKVTHSFMLRRLTICRKGYPIPGAKQRIVNPGHTVYAWHSGKCMHQRYGLNIMSMCSREDKRLPCSQ